LQCPIVQKIIIDTNFLLMQFEYGIDLQGELLRIARGPVALIIFTGTINELKTLSGRTGRRATAARFALQHFDSLKKRFTVEILESAGPVDGCIIKYAQKNPVCVATNDVPLRQRVLAMGVPAIVMKSKAKLDYA
jgi:rRNA-processing protein FCF1